ncbi:MAG TPA: MFS transporter [Candidatus Alistipes merdigallinarum]|nr:MFS transporter [Candidatus Alistipes merdigallinarum]
MKKQMRSPWAWIPTLYLAEGLPYVAVMTLSVILYKRLGISNTDIALYTSWLYLPWVIKPFWSPFVDLLKTKRWWIVSMQLLLGAGFAGIAFTIPVSFFFQATLAFFWLMAFSSATHDIAADGFYMLALDHNQQALYVGIRSTFYRVATILGQGLLIILAGWLESATGPDPVKIDVEVSPQYTCGAFALPEVTVPMESAAALSFVVSQPTVTLGTAGTSADSVRSWVGRVEELNRSHGFLVEERAGEQTASETETGWWTTRVSRPLGEWIRTHFGERREAEVTTDRVGSIGIAAVSLSREPGPDEEVVLNTTMNRGDRSVSLIHGERLRFDRTNWNQPAYLVFQADAKLNQPSHAEYKGLSGNIPFAWSITFFVLAGLFVLFGIYHRFVLPRPATDHGRSDLKPKDILREFSATFVSFFKKPQAAAAIFFMLTFRFSEAQLLKLINPFLLDSKEIGGLGLTTGEVGMVYGTVGIIGLTIGGIIGGIAAARGGLRKWIWPMTLSMLLTCLTFVYLSFSQTDNLFVINTCVFVEQFGYGFGFTAYMLYLMYFADGEQKTAHYAICTGFMALGMMLPGMFAGWMQEMLGYNHFFVWVMLCSIVPIVAVALLKIDPNYGKKESK